MARFSKIEIHFRDNDTGDRRVVILPNSSVQAIFLRRSAAKFLTFEDAAGKHRPRAVRRAPGAIPQGVTLEGRLFPRDKTQATVRGPGEVCYLENNELKCWDPDE